MNLYTIQTAKELYFVKIACRFDSAGWIYR